MNYKRSYGGAFGQAMRPFVPRRRTVGALLAAAPSTFYRYRSGRGGARPRYAGYYRSNNGKFKKEVKGVDTNLTGTAAAPGSADPITNAVADNQDIFLLNGIQQGSGSWNRVGRYIYNKSVKIDLELSMEANQVNGQTQIVQGQYVRVVLLWDNAPNSATIPLWNNIFGWTDQAGNEASTIAAPLRYDNMMRFKILRDWKIEPKPAAAFVNSATPATADGIQNVWICRLSEYVKLGNLLTNFSGNSSPVTTADISTGALYLAFRANSTGVTNTWSVLPNSVCRLRFTD